MEKDENFLYKEDHTVYDPKICPKCGSTNLLSRFDPVSNEVRMSCPACNIEWGPNDITFMGDTVDSKIYVDDKPSSDGDKFKHPDGCCPICGNRDLVIRFNGDDVCDVYLHCGKCRVSYKPNEIFDTLEKWVNSVLGKQYNDMATRRVKESINEKLEEKEMVSHPDHYQSNKGIEVIDVIEAFTEDLTGVEAFDTGNIIKYICRWNKKSKPVEDLKKVVWYTQHLINHLENKENE